MSIESNRMWKGVYKCVECESENEAPLGHSNICEICGSAEDPNVIAYRSGFAFCVFSRVEADSSCEVPDALSARR